MTNDEPLNREGAWAQQAEARVADLSASMTKAGTRPGALASRPRRRSAIGLFRPSSAASYRTSPAKLAPF